MENIGRKRLRVREKQIWSEEELGRSKLDGGRRMDGEK